MQSVIRFILAFMLFAATAAAQISGVGGTIA
jgi:hypothetical protein